MLLVYTGTSSRRPFSHRPHQQSGSVGRFATTHLWLYKVHNGEPVKLIDPYRRLLGLASMLVASCVGTSAPSSLLPSELISRPDYYDGKHVEVRGYVVIGPESRNMFDSRIDYENHRGACLGLDGSERRFRMLRTGQVSRLSGVFRKTLCGPGDICLFWCPPSGIELDVHGAHK